MKLPDEIVNRAIDLLEEVPPGPNMEDVMRYILQEVAGDIIRWSQDPGVRFKSDTERREVGGDGTDRTDRAEAISARGDRAAAADAA